MSKYQDRLMKHIEENPDFIKPESRKKEMVNNFLKPGLQDLCVSRTSFNWGIPVEFDPGHVVYVWIDALSNYITALGYDPDGERAALYEKYWPADVHIIGKDILRFHTIYWPIMLMALGEPLPKQIFGHPWLLFGADKMSKSRGNVMYADDLVRQFGVDPIRYYLLSEMPYAQDGSITYETIIARINSDLANIFGNLVNRTVAMVNKYFDGIVPEPVCKEDIDDELKDYAEETVRSVLKSMEDLKVADCLEAIINLARRSNKYIDETMPWALAKEEAKKERLGTVLYHLIESVRILGILIGPFLPETGEKVLKQLNVKTVNWDSVIGGFGKTEPGIRVNKEEPLFLRIDEKKKLAEITEELEAKREPEPQKTPQITIDDFSKVQLKVGKVLECSRMEKADKLLVFKIDMGTEVRQIVSGIAKYYAPEELVGKNVIVAANLKPVKLRGVLSEGMILSAEAGDNLSVLTTLSDVPGGSDVR